jgi:hypothetical protein
MVAHICNSDQIDFNAIKMSLADKEVMMITPKSKSHLLEDSFIWLDFILFCQYFSCS